MPNNNNKPNLDIEERDDGLLIHLRDEVDMLVKYHSPTQVQVEMWRKDVLLAPDVGNLITSAFRKKLVAAAKDAFKAENVPNIAKDIDAVATALTSSPTPGGPTLQSRLQEKTGPTVTERLILYARQAGKFFH